MFKSVFLIPLCLLLTLSPTYAEDSEEVLTLKREIKLLREEVSKLTERVQRSINDQKKIAAERDRLKTELSELIKKPKEPEDAPAFKLLPLGSRWKGDGKYQDNKGLKVREIEITVIQRQGKSAVVRTVDPGFSREWTLEIGKDGGFNFTNPREVGVVPNGGLNKGVVRGTGKVDGEIFYYDYVESGAGSHSWGELRRVESTQKK